MATTVETRTPAHLWVVGVLSLLWNFFGCLDYTMTNLKNAAWLAKMSPDQLAYMNSLPGWLTAFWAIGVWGGLIGSILLLMRNRYAVWAFGLSYPRTGAGLLACYAAGVPFFWNTLAGDGIYAALLFGGFALAERVYPALREPSFEKA